jgi:glycosyltransferase involved in cell wall biosynthesis
VNTDFFTYRNVLPEKPQALLSGTYNKIYDEFLINRFNSYMRSNFQHEVLWARGREAGFKTQDLGQTKSDTFTYDEMPSIVAASSYGIAVCKNYLGPSLYAAMPTKIAEFLSVGRPVVVNSNLGDVQTRLLDQGVAISLNNVADIPKAAKNLIDLLDDPKTPERCRRIAVKYFSLETATKTYAEIYRSISNSFQG